MCHYNVLCTLFIEHASLYVLLSNYDEYQNVNFNSLVLKYESLIKYAIKCILKIKVEKKNSRNC